MKPSTNKPLQTFSQIRDEAIKLLNDDKLSALRDLLQIAASRGYITGLTSRSSCPLNTNVGKQRIRDLAKDLIEDATITPTGMNVDGWTKTLIDKYLGNPDKRVPNPHYKSASAMQLYYVYRVNVIAQQPEVAAALQRVLENRENRQAGAAKAVETRTAKLREWVNSLEVKIPVMPIDELLKQSTIHYGWLHQERGRYEKSASITDSADFLERITMNYLRHDGTDYEHQLEDMSGKVGITRLYPVLKEKINNAIREAYPSLYSQILEYQENYQRIEAEARAVKKLERDKIQAEKDRVENEFCDRISSGDLSGLIQWLAGRLNGLLKDPVSVKKKVLRNYRQRTRRAATALKRYADLAKLDLPELSNKSQDLQQSDFESMLERIKSASANSRQSVA